jgi:hypothetical protein
MNCFKSKYRQHFLIAILAVMAFCFWLFLYPFIPVVREMSELFLWTGDYFVERIVIPGGLAQYLGEMIGQLFINPMNGAIAYAILFIVTRQLLDQWLRKAFPTLKETYRFLLSLVLPAVLWLLAMFPDIPLTMTIAIILVMGVGCVLMTVSNSKRRWMLLPTIPVMYWLAGPAAVLLVFCCIRWISVTVPLFAVCLIGSSYLVSNPLRQVAMGIDYFAGDNRIGLQMSTYEEMECDMLLRQREWHQILRKFQHPVSPAVRSAVLIAYYKTGQMGKRELMANLVVPSEQQDNAPSVFNTGDMRFIVYFGSVSSAFMVSDMAYLLYWTNISQRAAFDAMEYIPNYNKSGRALKRLVETNIISGHYDVARKYISILEKTTFYRKWAQSMRLLIDNPELIENNSFLRESQKTYADTEDVFFI